MATGKRKTYEEIELLFKSKGLTLITKEFKTTKTKMKYICELGHTGETTPRSISEQGTGCRECSKERLSEMYRLPFEHVEQEFAKESYTLLSKEYRNSDQLLSYMCNIGHTGLMNYSNLQCGKRCPACNQSKGEKQVQLYLDQNNYIYTQQKRIDECRYMKPLPFDFGIYSENELLCLIEYQGIHHYEPVDFAGKGREWAEEQFKNIVKRDNIKRKYCKENKIPLIEIPYTVKEKDIHKFLEVGLNILLEDKE